MIRTQVAADLFPRRRILTFVHKLVIAGLKQAVRGVLHCDWTP